MTLSAVCAQVFLVLAALVAVPIMLVPKPLILQRRWKERAAQLESYGRVSPHDDDEEAAGALRMAAPAAASHHEEEFDFSEVMVHQVRRTCLSYHWPRGVGDVQASFLRGMWCPG